MSVVVIPFAGSAQSEPGRAAFLLGDSVMVGAQPVIGADAAARGWSVTIVAKVGRTTSQGAAILHAMRQTLPPVVVIELGNNDGENPAAYRSAIDSVMLELVGVRHVVWYTMTPFASWVPSANAELEAAVGRWPNLQLAEWGTLSEQTVGALYGTGPHVLPPGAQAFADLLFSTLDHLGVAVPVVETFSEARPRVVSGAPQSGAPIAAATDAYGTEHWFVTPDGHVSSRVGTPALGSLTSAVNAPIVGMTAMRSGHGYWLVASDGGVFTFGDARFFGSTGALRLNRPIVGMTATRSGRGYWLVASDGGVFTFGDARFYGSTGAQRLNASIVGIAASPSGHGYWLVASDGGVFAFGDAPYDGSGVAFHTRTGASFVGIAADRNGYELSGFTTGGTA